MLRKSVGVATLVAALTFVGTPALAQIERFDGTIANTTGVGPGLQQFTIRVERYTSDAEADRFFDLLNDEGPEALQRSIWAVETARFQLVGQLGHSLGLARSQDAGDGVRIIRFVAARPISLSEQIDSTRSLDYPFTVIVLRLDETGRGDGLFVPAAKLSIGDNQQLEVESLGIASNYPIRSVKAQP